MEISIETLRKSKNTDYSKLTEEIEKKTNPNKRTVDERFWKPERDKSGNGAALIRFLSVPGSKELPFVTEWSYFFKGSTGKYYVEKSLQTLGLPDPVYEANGAAFDSEDPDRIKVAKSRNRQLGHIANILVIEDKANPENNGKVFLYKFGKKIYDKIIAKQNPEFESEEPVVVWDTFEGADFRMRIKTVSENGNKWPNYDESSFDAPKALHGGDEDKMLATLKAQHDIQEFVDPKNFKSYDVLKAKFIEVTGEGGNSRAVAENDTPAPQAAAPEPASQEAAPAATTESAFDAFDDDIPF